MTNNTAVTMKIQSETPYKFNRKIGATNYVVSLNFSKTNQETMNDKIMRLIKSEVQSGK